VGNVLSVPILILAAAVQSTIAPQIQLLGGRPDLVLLLVVLWSLHASLEESVTWAFVGGVLQDLLSASPTGTSAVGMILLVFVIDWIKQQVYSIGFLLRIGLVLGATVVQQIVIIVILLVLGFRITLFDMAYVLFPTLIYNLVFMWPTYWFVRGIQRRLGV
jgi:rod shape-determining protein MreD